MSEVLEVVEAVYDVDASRTAWLRAIAERTRAAFSQDNVGAYALTYDVSDVENAKFGKPMLVGVASEDAERVLSKEIPSFYRARPPLVEAIFRHVGYGPSTRLPWTPEDLHLVHDLLKRAGIREILGINGVSVDGRSVHAGVLLSRPAKNIDYTALARISSHFAAGARLRRRLDEAKTSPLDAAEAILDESGKVLEASGKAKLREARATLSAAAASLTRLKKRTRKDPERALAQWRALVDARWSLVDHFERDGKHFVLAERNDPALGPLELLSERELQVVALAAMGHANKMIAYELGIAVSTVGVLLSRAAARLGAKSRAALVNAYNNAKRA